MKRSTLVRKSRHHGNSTNRAPGKVDLRHSSNTAQADYGSFARRKPSSTMELRVMATSLERRLTAFPRASFTMDKLRFEGLGLVGRDHETAVLQQCLLDTTARTVNQLVLIQGVSGSGKSALAQTALTTKAKVFVMSKFSRDRSDQPYSTIITACHDLATNHQIVEHQLIPEQLQSQLGAFEIQLLVHAVPSLGSCFVSPQKSQSSNEPGTNNSNTYAQQGGGGGENRDLLESAFRKFLRIVSANLAPLVLVIDDLQWADSQTIGFIKGLTLDTHNPNLLLVGCYRSNEVDDTHILSQMVRELKQQEFDTKVEIHELDCNSLEEDQVNQILMRLLDSEDDADKTLPLAKLCHARTMGNAFFLLVFIRMLEKDKLLTFNYGTFTWKWDIDTILSKTAATSNVVELLTNKIKALSPDLVLLLQLACCLGTEFHASALFLVWATSSSSQVEDNETRAKDQWFKKLLEGAIQEHFLERADEGCLRWVHDKVQETVTALDSQEELLKRKQSVGRSLYKCLDDEDFEESLFVVTDLLNCGASDLGLELAKLNLRAAKKANALSAFKLQGNYAQAGIENLPENDCWLYHKDLAVDLYSMQAQAASNTGDFDTMHQSCQIVLKHPQCSMLDKIPCYNAEIHALARTSKIDEAMMLTVEVLNMLGCKIPLGKGSQIRAAIKSLLRFKRQMKKKTPTLEGLALMPLMTDPVQKAVMKLLAGAATFAYHTKAMPLWLLFTTTMYYLADHSQTAFASCGLIAMHVLGNWEMGVHFASLACKMNEHLQESSQEAAAIAVSRGLIINWRQPSRSQQKFLEEGYEKGMAVGDLEWAFACVVFTIEVSFTSGQKLGSVLEDINTYLPQCEALHASNDYAWMIRSIWQAIMNLTQNAKDPCVLTGDAMKEEDMVGAVPTTHTVFHILKHFVCVVFGNYELGAELALERAKVKTMGPMGPCDHFLRALSFYAAMNSCHSKSQRRTFRRAAKASHKVVKTLVKKGSVNVLHHLELLNAERAALDGGKNVNDLYSAAGRSATRGGYIQDAAIVSERHALFLMERNDDAGAAFRMKDAVECYHAWGATAKVNQLREKYPQFLDF
ncbi:Transcriptional regulator [Seminavis robusta]|uniref:Transcriptional regulator n=1 Tax=Seminavis robusta TaxID=568900 RepID=A0A9N8E9W6_9STRA|nr:Transcriptional regulator [Seminavis robusta]|eukprot:Sro860_g212150.1 Transcriptional regulator (1083) ;mRNA; f:25442-28879